MNIGSSIYKLRSQSKLSQEQFARLFDVSQQSVQKWENGDSLPELTKLLRIAKHFGVSLDALIMDNDNRTVEGLQGIKLIKPQYANIHDWEFYSSYLMTEYQQSVEEGLDIEAYKDVFQSISRLPKDENKKRLGDILFDIVVSAKTRADYPYIEPSDLDTIKSLRRPYSYKASAADRTESRIQGAWLGRICGCLLGKTVECIRTNELIPFLKATDNYPMHRYILHSDLEKVNLADYKFWFSGSCYADTCNGMPIDDDTNYTVLYQEIIEKYGRDFTPFDVSRAWMALQPKDAYCTAERVAFCNFVKGYAPPESAIYKNPYREWIGAQIRADYFGYINPGDPETAAEMAWRDASVSHIKNGIYGEMWVAAMLAEAARTDSIKNIILGGLAQIPYTSRLYEDVMWVVESYDKGISAEDCFAHIHKKYDEYTEHGWCHTISNAMIVAAALLYGGGDYGRSICMAVQTGFDTDCNGATVGSVLGVALGAEGIPEYWTAPIQDTLHTSIFGIGTVKISNRVKMTLNHLK